MSARAAAKLVALLLVACSSEPAPVTAPRSARGAPITFAYGTPSGESLSSETTRGRVTALLFVTTFDLPSQLMAQRLDVILRGHKPRINAGAVALEAPNSAPLVDVFKSSLGLSYPVGLVNVTDFDQPTPFGKVDAVPTLVVLDARGREVARAHGVVTERELDEVLTRAAE